MVASVVILLAVFATVNLVYQVIRKPTELFFFVGHRLDKEPAETWRQYGPLFRTYSTST
ncbi:MAG: lytic transglycosylase domain-containing protein, partial [Bradyrhizobium sp.]|nr:lytic transglycosylase domain-containing protein [Bradyrhizobium sp.]